MNSVPDPPSLIIISAYMYVRGRSSLRRETLCYLLISRLSGLYVSRVMSTKQLRDVRSKPHHRCYILRMGRRSRLISILQNWQHGHSRLRSRLLGSLAGISHDFIYCHYHTATRESRTTTLSITIQAIVDQLAGWLWGGYRVVRALQQRCFPRLPE